MRRITVSSVACLVLPYFSHYLTKARFSGGGIIEQNVIWFSLHLLYDTFLVLRRIQRHIIINVHRSSYKIPVILSRFYCNLKSIANFRKILNIKFHENPSSVSRVVPCGQTDGQTDMNNVTAACRKFANAPTNEKYSCRRLRCLSISALGPTQANMQCVQTDSQTTQTIQCTDRLQALIEPGTGDYATVMQ